MKKIVLLALALVSVAVSAGVPEAVHRSQSERFDELSEKSFRLLGTQAGGGSISIYATYISRVNYSEVNRYVQAFLREGIPPSGTNDHPTNFSFAVNFDYHRAMVSTNAALWFGKLNPTKYSEQRGSWLTFPFKVVSTNVFKPQDILMELKSNDRYKDAAGVDHPLGTLGYIPVLKEWAPEAVALWWGPNGVKGDDDDELRIAGDGVANEAWYTGPGTAYIGDTQSFIDVIRTYQTSIASASSPFLVSLSVKVHGLSNKFTLSSHPDVEGTSVVVPEPPKLILSSDGRNWIANSTSSDLFHVQETRDFKIWTTIGTPTKAKDLLISTIGTGNKFFRLYQP